MTATSSEIGNLMILASAGSGKTHQLVNRMIALVARGVDPREIVALTFTRKAAGEFADAVLSRLADAALDETKAADLREQIGINEVDFQSMLEQVSQALPHWMLGTIDSFFTRILRAFQQELGLVGGSFELLQGPRAEMVAERLLEHALVGSSNRSVDEEFGNTFRRATMGREDVQVQTALRKFVDRWQERFAEAGEAEWGPAALCALDVQEWEKLKGPMAKQVRAGLSKIDGLTPGQEEAMEKLVDLIEGHTIGSGVLGENKTTLWKGMLDDLCDGKEGLMELSYRKAFCLPEMTADSLRDLLKLCVRCELAAAGRRTQAIKRVMSRYDELAEREVRSRGLLGFQEVKWLMGQWVHDEEARLRREAIDFCLDARYRHWLLDEFQDTSRADWNGLSPLVEEAFVEGDGSVFLVGDKKQAIYAWRGGDVSLFDEIYHRFAERMEKTSMAESYRSCPQVLDLVNRICGDRDTISRLFPGAADTWEWQDHHAAERLLSPAKAGESRVESLAGWEAKLERILKLLGECRVGDLPLTCAVLVRQNSKAKEVADFLREHGYDVVLDGVVHPTADCPPGVLILQSVRWLANPADSLARGVLEMSPPGIALFSQLMENWQMVWTHLSEEVSSRGYAETFRKWLGPYVDSWSSFGQERLALLLGALEQMDRRGVVVAAEAVDWLERLECSQPPSAAAVQVMTIHKSKGLGFDMVILPEISNDSIPAAQRFEIAEKDGWILEAPPQWVRSVVPELRSAEEEWARGQRYEAMCLLYVALTRAKRGLYVLLDHLPKKPDLDRPSLSNWIRNALGIFDEGELFGSGEREWSQSLEGATKEPDEKQAVKLGNAVARPGRVTATQAKADRSIDPAAVAYGNEVHALLEKIDWLDDGMPSLPDSAVGRAVKDLLESDDLKPFFFRQGRQVSCHTEQAVESFLDGERFSGVIDRLLIHRNSEGKVEKVEIIDWKTDAVEDPDELRNFYPGQIESYRAAISQLFPKVGTLAYLVSVHHTAVVTC